MRLIANAKADMGRSALGIFAARSRFRPGGYLSEVILLTQAVQTGS